MTPPSIFPSLTTNPSNLHFTHITKFDAHKQCSDVCFLEKKLKCSRLVNSKQGLPNEEDHLDYVTLLTSCSLIVVLSFSVLQSPEVLKCFEMLKHIPAVPFLLPQETITDIKASEEMLFILYEHGIVGILWLKVQFHVLVPQASSLCARHRILHLLRY